MKKLLMLLVATFVIVMSLKAQNFDTEKVLRHLNRAEVCIEMNKIDDAIKEYQEIVKIAPNWSNVYMYLGNSYSLKDDDISLSKSIEYYNKFLQMTDDQELYIEAKDRLSRVEMVRELKAKETENMENLVGTWKTSFHDKYTGKPWFVFKITKTPNPNKFQISLSSQSMMYGKLVNSKDYSEIIDGNMNWTYTFQESYIPSQAKYNTQGMIMNMMAGDNRVAAAILTAYNESKREADVGYTDINEFSFGCNVNIRHGRYEDFSDGYLTGSCYMKGEHHQNGLNQVVLDSLFACDYLKGEENFPVLLEIEKTGKSYKYGNKTTNDVRSLLKMGGYVDNELSNHPEEITKPCVAQKLCGPFIVTGLIGGVTSGIVGLCLYNKDRDLANQWLYYGALGFGGGMFVVGAVLGAAGDTYYEKRYNKYYDKLIIKHNEKVKENKNKYGSEISFVASPIGVGLQMTF